MVDRCPSDVGARDIDPIPSEPASTLTRHRRFNTTPEVRLSLRAGFCLSAPLVVGLIVNQRSYAIVFAIGALWAISQDGLDEWRVRGRRLFWVAVAATVGVAMGATFVGHDSSAAALVVFLGVAALIAGFVEASNWASQGAYLLIGSIIGAGLRFSGRVWQSCLCVALGSLWVYAVAALTDRRNRLANQRVFLSNAFEVLASLVEALDTPRFYTVRARAVTTLDAAQDVVGSRRRGRDGTEEVALRQCLIVALRCGEVVSYLEGKHLRADASVASALREVAGALRTTTGLNAVALLRDLPARFNDIIGLDPTITSALVLSDPRDLPATPPRSSAPALARATLPIVERLRFAAILSLAIVAGTLVANALDGLHGFWLPLSIAFILRPDLGPVITRALARTVGTVVGVGIAALVALSGNSIGLLIALSCVMAATVPWATRRSHVLAVITFTPIVFVFLSLLGTEKYLFAPRIIDTAIGAAIVLILDVALWTTAPSLRPAQQLEKARAASARYEREATIDDPLRRHLLRRAALRAVTNARSALDQAQKEPRLLQRLDPTTLQQLDEVESAIDTHTVSLLEQHST
ncbi:MAG TPA: FUSC family protein [Acidimicrobiales bacterium]|nr:FUSC family protein [Acidimicrobiales bacterium]